MLKRLSAATMGVALLAGCEPTHLYVVHTTVVGVDAGVNTQQTAGHLIVGYDRKFAAVVPKSVARDDGGKEAMAALSCSETEVSGIFLTGFTEYLATGEAAKEFAARLGRSDRQALEGKRFFECAEENK